MAVRNDVLKYLRLSKKRVLEDPEKQAQKFSAALANQKAFALIRKAFHISAGIPSTVSASRKMLFHFCGSGKGFGSYSRIYKELKSNNLFDECVVASTPLYHRSKILLFFRTLPKAIFVCFSYAYLKFSTTQIRNDPISLFLLIELRLWERFYKKTWLRPIVSSDLSPRELARGFAAARVNCCALWWQDDWYHTTPPPFKITCAYIKNDLAAENLIDKFGEISFFASCSMFTPRVVVVKENPRVGIATNAFFSQSNCGWEAIANIRSHFQGLICLRRHPRDYLEYPSIEGLAVRRKEESIDEFVDSVDLVFVGNSLVQLEIVLRGCPVVHVEGLDPFSFDQARFVERRLVYGERRIDQCTFERAKCFYESSYNYEGVKKFVTRKKCETIDLRYLGATSNHSPTAGDQACPVTGIGP